MVLLGVDLLFDLREWENNNLIIKINNISYCKIVSRMVKFGRIYSSSFKKFIPFYLFRYSEIIHEKIFWNFAVSMDVFIFYFILFLKKSDKNSFENIIQIKVDNKNIN